MGVGSDRFIQTFYMFYVGAVQQATNQAFPQGLQKKRHAKAQVPTTGLGIKSFFISNNLEEGKGVGGIKNFFPAKASLFFKERKAKKWRHVLLYKKVK